MNSKKQSAFLTGSYNILARLDHGTLPLWGKMTAQHMVEHLSAAIGMSLRNTVYDPPTDPEIINNHKINMLSNGLKRGTILDDGKLSNLKNSDLFSAIAVYTSQVNDFLNAIETGTLSTYHIYFGQLTNAEWLTFHYWHIRHHCHQFGLI